MPKALRLSPDALLPLTPVVFEILVSLANGDQHGYSIMADVRARTGASVRAGSLYRAIARLVENELIEEIDERPDAHEDDERRRYYRLTTWGRRVAQAEAARLDQQVRQARAARLLPKPRG